MLDERNSCRVMFIMFVVENELRRIEVIKIFVNYKLILYYKDLKGLMVFYYCLGLCNDDEICVNYLNIFLL